MKKGQREDREGNGQGKWRDRIARIKKGRNRDRVRRWSH